jgi:hypothetical protein
MALATAQGHRSKTALHARDREEGLGQAKPMPFLRSDGRMISIYFVMLGVLDQNMLVCKCIVMVMRHEGKCFIMSV